MKTTILFSAALMLLGSVATLAGSDIFAYVRATPQGDDIQVQWRTANETNIQSYEIERKSDEVTEYRRLGRVMAKGSGTTYTFVDDGAFYKPTAGKRFTYRIHAVGTGVEQYSSSATVVHEVSSVRRSWGMIKELFR